MSSKKYYKSIDFIRLIACIAVLLYHLNILKGGYLAVCIFFVLSGYLSCVSAFKKEKFSLLQYYKNRLSKLYIPLIIVVFITIAIISFLPNINWFNLKPETTSVLFGYNNFWQLGANLDYFASHSSSPFIHLWYIAILLQFDLIFPLIYLILRKLGDKFNKALPCVLTAILSTVSMLYFYNKSFSGNIMFVYYDTLTRVFSLLFGVTLGFIHSYYDQVVPKTFKNNLVRRVIFAGYTFILIVLFIFVDAQSVFFPISMILSTIITCRLIDYGTINVNDNINIWDKIVKFLSGISYEIYLIQYPVIYLLQDVAMISYIKVPLIIILTILISYILNFSLKNNSKFKNIRYVVGIIICFVAAYGLVQFVMAKDYSNEMKQLEEQLAQNQLMIEQKQQEYELQMKQENDDWESILLDLENGEAELENMVNNLSIVGIGDSVMLGAVQNLYSQFLNGYFDAATSRTAWVAAGIIRDLKSKNILGNPILLNLGANGDCPESCKSDIVRESENRKIFWINVTNDERVHVNDDILELTKQFDNVHIIDWNSFSKGHPEYFIVDGIHLTTVGKEAYTKFIYDSIYQVYLEEYRSKKEEIINKHEEEKKNKISFYGNGVLLNAFDDIHSYFPEAQFIINKQFDYKTLKQELEKAKSNNSLTYKIVLAIDNSIHLSLEQYEELVELCDNNEIYIVSFNKEMIDVNSDNLKVIDFYNEINNNDNYMMIDKIHLTKEGNKALSEKLKQNLLHNIK